MSFKRKIVLSVLAILLLIVFYFFDTFVSIISYKTHFNPRFITLYCFIFIMFINSVYFGRVMFKPMVKIRFPSFWLSATLTLIVFQLFVYFFIYSGIFTHVHSFFYYAVLIMPMVTLGIAVYMYYQIYKKKKLPNIYDIGSTI